MNLYMCLFVFDFHGPVFFFISRPSFFFLHELFFLNYIIHTSQITTNTLYSFSCFLSFGHGLHADPDLLHAIEISYVDDVYGLSMNLHAFFSKIQPPYHFLQSIIWIRIHFEGSVWASGYFFLG